MTKLANDGLGKVKELAIGIEDDDIFFKDLYDELSSYFAKKGLNTIWVNENDSIPRGKAYDVIIYVLENWKQKSIYLSPFTGKDISPEITISTKWLQPIDYIMDKITGFLEVYGF